MLRQLVIPHDSRRDVRSGSRLRLFATVLLVAVMVLVLAPAAPASASESGTIHSLVNQARSAAGLGGLNRNAALDQVAANWANQLAASGQLSHNPSYSAQIPGGWSNAGENVAQGQPTGAAMHDAWMASDGHRANILGGYTDVGIAFVAAGGTTWGVEVFAAYAGSGAAAAAPAPAAAAPSAATQLANQQAAQLAAEQAAAATAAQAAAEAAAQLAAQQAAEASAAAAAVQAEADAVKAAAEAEQTRIGNRVTADRATASMAAAAARDTATTPPVSVLALVGVVASVVAQLLGRGPLRAGTPLG